MSFNSILVKIIVLVIIMTAMLCIAQVWGLGIDEATFIKSLITLGIIGGVLGLIIMTRADFSENKNLKDDDYIGQ